MSDKYSTAIILSHGKNDQKKPLSDRTIERTEQGIQLYRNGLVSTLIMSGAYAGPNNNLRIFSPHAHYMINLAIEKKVNKNHLFLEDKSLDTVAQALFTKLKIISPKNWEKIVVVSSNYHMERVEKIFRFIYGKEFDFKFVSSELGTQKKSNPQEIKSFETFLNTFNGIKSGNDKSIVTRLFEKHPYYMGLDSSSFLS